MAIEIDQEKVDAYYENLKYYISEWLVAFLPTVKNLTLDDLAYFNSGLHMISFDNVWAMNNYMQNLKYVSQRDKRKMNNFVNGIIWLPEDCPIGVLDGKVVTSVNPIVFCGTQLLVYADERRHEYEKLKQAALVHRIIIS